MKISNNIYFKVHKKNSLKTKNNQRVYSKSVLAENISLSSYYKPTFGNTILIEEVDKIAKEQQLKKKGIKELQEYVGLIRNPELRKLTNKILKETKDPFFVVPSSTTLKYHNPDNNQLGGMTLHLKKAVIVALQSARRYGIEYGKERHSKDRSLMDMVIASTIIHDCPFRLVKDKGKYFTDKNHSVNNAKYLEKTMEELGFSRKKRLIMSAAVGFHMGIWDKHTDKEWFKSHKFLKEHPVVKIVQEADYYSTRRNIDVDTSLKNLGIKNTLKG